MAPIEVQKVVRAYTRDKFGNIEELGLASKVETSIEFPTSNQLMVKGEWVQTGPVNQTVIFEDWKTPVQTVRGSNLRIMPLAVLGDGNLELLVAALVRMFGGSVSISEEEFSEALDMNIEAFNEIGPQGKRFIIKVEPK